MKRTKIFLALASVSLVSSPVFAAGSINIGSDAVLNLELGVTTVVQSTDGLEEEESRASYSFDVAAEVDLGDKGVVFASLNTAQGGSVDTGAIAGSNGDDESGDISEGGYSETRVAELWYQLPVNELVTVTVGKIDPTGIFDANEYANDETAQFLGDTFINNMAVPFPGYAAGLHVGLNMSESIQLNFGAFEPKDDFEGTLDESFFMAEATFSLSLGGRDGNYRVGYWSCDACGDETNSGVTLSFDQAVTDNLGLFLRYGDQDEAMDGYDSAITTGLQYASGDHQVGAGYSILAAEADGADDETQWEIYYSHACNDYLTLTADIQSISAPGLDSDADDVTVFGVRAQLSF